MEVTPIKHGFVHFKKCDLVKNRLLLGVDCGCSLTKVVFLHKDNTPLSLADDTDFVTLTYAIFNNEDFTGAMKVVRDQAYIPEYTKNYVHITGNIDYNKKQILESILGLKTEYVDETLATIAGHRIALEQIGLEALIAAPVEVESYGEIDSKFMDHFLDAVKAKFSKSSDQGERSPSSIFPCLVNAIGSSSEYYYFDNDGKAENIGDDTIGGTTFLGLAKCLLDTNKYKEIMELASVGDRRNVDTQVKDIFIGDSASPYGTFPSDMPVFCFGKGMDYNTGLEDYSKADVAKSIIGFFSLCLIMRSGQISLWKRLPKIYLSGNIFISDLFQREIKLCQSVFPIGLEFEVLDLGYSGALGAIFCSNDDKNKYLIQ